MVKVIDSIMGSGKTNYAIQMMNNNPDKKYIYITPYLDEINRRIIKECPTFEQPQEVDEDGEPILKQESFHQLLKEGKNIISTHQLFKMSTKHTLDLLKKNNYILIIDEVMEVVNYSEIPKHDLQIALEVGLCYKENDYLLWNDNYRFKDGRQYIGKNYKKLKTLCKNNSIFVVNDEVLVWVFPPKIFDYFCIFRSN
jgi:hypothetical protein